MSSEGGMKVDDMKHMEVRNGRLFWMDNEVVTKQQVSLRAYEAVLATIATMAAVTAALWPILIHFEVV